MKPEPAPRTRHQTQAMTCKGFILSVRVMPETFYAVEKYMADFEFPSRQEALMSLITIALDGDRTKKGR